VWGRATRPSSGAKLRRGWIRRGLIRRNTKSSGLSAEPKRGEARFVVCVRNTGYPAPLELRKLYRLLNDGQAFRHGLLRVIDESGEDYLYPEEYFVPVKLPHSVQRDLGWAKRKI